MIRYLSLALLILATTANSLAAGQSLLDKLDPAAVDADIRKAIDIRELVGFIRPHSRAVAHVTFSRDGKLLASSGWDNAVQVHKLGEKAPTAWAKLDASPSGIAFSPDGKRLATGCDDTQVIVWDLTGDKPKQEHKLSGHTARPFALAFAPVGKMLASGSNDPVLRVFKLDDLTPEAWAVLPNKKTTARAVSSLAFTHDGKHIVAGCLIGKEALRIWDNAGKERAVLAATARLIACSPREPVMAFAGDDAPIHLWKLGDNRVEKLRTLPGHSGKAFGPLVKALAFSPDGKILASCGQDRHIRMWNVNDGEKVREWKLDVEPRTIAFASDGRHLAIGNADGSIFLLRSEKKAN